MKIVNLPIDKIKPYDKNPRKNDNAIDEVAKSISEFGFRQPLVLDENHVIIVGHTRFLAAVKIGLTEVPCHIAKDLNQAKIKAYRIMDNRTHEHSEWDKGLLLNELNSVFEENNNFNLDFFAFDTSFFDSTLGLNDLNEDSGKPEVKEKEKEYLLVCICDDENHQQELFNKFQDEGIKCKIM